MNKEERYRKALESARAEFQRSSPDWVEIESVICNALAPTPEDLGLTPLFEVI